MKKITIIENQIKTQKTIKPLINDQELSHFLYLISPS